MTESQQKRFFYTFAVLISLLVGLTFSLTWIYPLAYEKKNDLPAAYTPIRYQAPPFPFSDDYLYYLHVQEVLAGHPLSPDPTTFENKFKDRVTLHYTYGLSVVLCALGGLFTGSVEHAYYFNLFFYPALSTFLACMLCLLVTQNWIAAVPVALLAVHRTPDLNKIPHVLVTNLPLTLIAIILFYLSEKKKYSLPLLISLACILGVSPLTSVPNWFMSFGIVGFFFLTLFDQPLLRKKLFAVLVAGVALASPTMWFLWKNKPTFEEIWYLAIPPPPIIHMFDVHVFLKCLPYLVVPIALLLPFKFEKRGFILRVLGGLLLTFVVLCGLWGTYGGRYVVQSGGELLIYCMFLSGVYLVAQRWTSRLPARVFAGLACLFCVLYFVRVLPARAKIAESSFQPLRDQSFKEVTQWGMKNTKEGDVVVSLDFDLLVNLPIYAPMDSYIAHAMQSPAPRSERHQRFFETLRFYGVAPSQLETMLDEIECHLGEGKAPDPIQTTQMQLVLFYGANCSNKIPHEEMKEILEDYGRTLASPTPFHFRHTYFITSKHDRKWIAGDSPAAKLLSSGKPVFANQMYEVFPF